MTIGSHDKKLDCQVVLFDVVGTTIIESREGIINECFEDAFSFFELPVAKAFIRDSRGKSKREVIAEVVENHRRPSTLLDDVYRHFCKNVTASLHEFSPAPGANEIFRYLHERKIRIALGSGLPADLFQIIFNAVAWHKHSFAYIGTADDVLRGRPHPDMIFSLMEKLSIANPRTILKVGDTVSDIQEGRNAGASSAVILSGTQPEEVLVRENPDYILSQLMDITKFI